MLVLADHIDIYRWDALPCGYKGSGDAASASVGLRKINNIHNFDCKPDMIILHVAISNQKLFRIRKPNTELTKIITTVAAPFSE